MKNKKCVIAIIILSILFIGAIGLVCYQNINYQDLNKKYNKLETNYSKLETKYNNKANKKSETVDDHYKKFLKNMKNNREKVFNQYSNQYVAVKSTVNDKINTYFEIKQNGDLIMKVNSDDTQIEKKVKKYNNLKIDTNVLFMEVYNIANGGYKGIAYLKEDGKVYTASYEYDMLNNEQIISKEENYKYIVNIEPAVFGDSHGGGGNGPIYIDIEGNIFE